MRSVKAIADSAATCSERGRQHESRIDARHFGEDRYRIGTLLRAPKQSHSASFRTRKGHTLDKRMIDQRLTDCITATTDQRKHALIQTRISDGLLDYASHQF